MENYNHFIFINCEPTLYQVVKTRLVAKGDKNFKIEFLLPGIQTANVVKNDYHHKGVREVKTKYKSLIVEGKTSAPWPLSLVA